MSKDIANLIVEQLRKARCTNVPTASEAIKLSCEIAAEPIIKEIDKSIIDAINKGGVFSVKAYKYDNKVEDRVYNHIKKIYEDKGYSVQNCSLGYGKGGYITVSWYHIKDKNGIILE